jgi:predicted MFS family arabinose efflux permease
MFYLGFFVTFTWGILPKFLKLETIPWVFVGYGVALFTGSFGSGRIFDQFGWKPLLIANVVLKAITFIAVPYGYTQNIVWPFFIAAFCLGWCESLQNCVQQSTFMRYFSDNINPILSIFRCATGAGTSAGFLLPLVLDYLQMELVIVVLMFIGCGLFAYHEMKFGPEASAGSESAAENADDGSSPPVV